MKKYNIVKVLFITIGVILLLSWIFPAAYFQSELVDQGRLQMGLSDLFNYPLTALSYFGHIAVYILLVGGFYGILYKIPAYRTFLDKIAKIFKGKESYFLVIVSVLLAFGVSFAGLQLALILFVPFIVSLVLLLGYDKVVAAMTVVGSIAVGFVGLTFSTSNTSMLTSILSLKYDYQIGVRFVMLLVGVVLLLFNMFMYIKANKNKIVKAEVKEEKKEEKVAVKVESPKSTKTTAKKSTTTKKTTKSKSTAKKSTKSGKSNNKAALRDEEIIVIKESVVNSKDNDSYLLPTRVETTHKVWPFVLFFSLMFVLMFMAFINWGEGGFGIKLFDNLTEGANSFELFGFPIFAKIYGTFMAFGSWTVVELFVPMALVVLFLSIIYKVKFEDVCDGFVIGVKKALAPALVCVLVYTVLVAVTYHPFQTVLYKAFLDMSKSNFNVVTTLLVTFLSSVFNVEAAYVFQAALPYYASVVTKVDNYSLTAIIAQSMYGFALLFAPTSLFLMTALAYLKINYVDWLKVIWKLLVELFVVLLLIFIILAVI